jgi:hypothetical protein
MKLFWIINLVLFQASWVAAAFYTSYAAMVIGLLIAIHIYLSPSRISDVKLLILVIPGILADTLHIQAGTFSAGNNLFPLWLILLWCMFIMSLNHSLKWLANKKLYWASLFGGVGGTSSYLGGVKTGALSTIMPLETTALILACSWAVLFPLIILGYRYIQENTRELA